MTVNLSALGGAGAQFFDANGDPLSGGKLYSYAAGTTTPQTTYTTAAGDTAHTNPIVLNSAGRVPNGEIWITAGLNYKFVLESSAGVLIATYDNITGINGTGIATNASAVTYDPAGLSAVATTVQAKLREYVSVMDFGAVGDGVTNDTAAFQSAANIGGNIYVPNGTYKIVGQVVFGSNTTLNVAGGTVFTMDCSGENGRGFYFRKAINSGVVGNFIINASATSVSATDGARNSCIQFGNDSNDPAPTITQFCFARGSIEINISGALNVKGVYFAGWVEDTAIDGVSVTGTTNYAITCHWSSDTWPNLPTKTWHANNLTIRNCKIYQKTGFNKPGRGFTITSAGRAVIENCFSDTTTLGYNFFLGDYGYTYAQNVSQTNAFHYSLENSFLTGAGGLSVDCISSGVNGSPVWNGFDYNATVQIDNLDMNANSHSTGLVFAVTGIKKGLFSNINLYSDNVAQTREFLYFQLCGEAHITNSIFKHHRYMRCRTTDYVLVDGCTISKPAPTPNATSYALTLEGVDFANITNCVIKDARLGVWSLDNYDKNIRVTNCSFEQIGAAAIQVSYCSQLIISNNVFKDVGTTTTSTNIYGIQFDDSVTGFSITGNLFSTNEYRYLIFLSATTANGVITGNAFLDLNLAATTPAAVFKNASATNILIDTGTNVLGSGINLVYT
jgi:hypothetical protein